MSSPFQQQFSAKSPINQEPQYPKLKKRGRIPSEYFIVQKTITQMITKEFYNG